MRERCKLWFLRWYKNLCVFGGMLAVLIPILVLVLTGSAGQTAASLPRVELADEEDPLGVYSQPLKLKVGQMVSATNYAPGESAGDNVVYDIYREVMNIDVESQFAAMIGSAYSQQLGLATISNNLPDMFFCNQNELNDLIDQGMVEDLTDAYYKYASPALRLAVEYGYTGDISVWNDGNPVGLERTPSALNMVSKDGRIYGFPFLCDLFNGCPLIWIRTDWLAKYASSRGISYTDISEVMPKDFGEYLDIVEYFSTANLFGGKKSYGVAFGISNSFGGSGLHGISNVYNAYPDTFLRREDGGYSYGTLTDEFRGVMQLYSDFYTNGFIDPNSSLDGNQMKTALGAGKIGTFVGEYWHVMEYLSNSVAMNAECDWLPWAIRDFEGNVIRPMVPTNVTDKSCYSVRKGYSNPEVVFIIANHLVDRFFSDEGAYTKRIVEVRQQEKYRNLEVEMYAPLRMDAPNKNIRYAFDMQKALETGDSSELSLDCLELYEKVRLYADDPRGAGINFYGLYKVFGPTGAYRELTRYAEYDYEEDRHRLKVHFKRPGYEGMYTPEMLEYMGSVNDEIYTRLVEFYTIPGELTAASWQKFVGGVNENGMAAILESLEGVGG